MAQKSEQQLPQVQNEEKGQNDQNNQNGQELSEVDKQVYEQIFKSLRKMDKKVQSAKHKLQDKDSAKKQQKNTNFKQTVDKLIEAKQNSEIVNKQDLLTDVNQSFQRAVVDVYSQNQRLKKKQVQMQRIIKQQNRKIFEHQTKQQNLNTQIQKLKFQLAQAKDNNLMINRGPLRVQNIQDSRNQPAKKAAQSKIQNSQSNEDYDFWNTPQNDNYSKKKKQFVQNSGLWVNQKNIGESMFITQGRK